MAALLQYKNTPLADVDLSPAQILFHRDLKDAIPSHPNNYRLHRDWVIAAEEREACFAKRNAAITKRYNQHTRTLPDISTGTHVLVQGSNRKWKKQGIVVEKLPHRQYKVKVLGSGRVTLRNRRFLKPCTAITPPQNTSFNKDSVIVIPRPNRSVHVVTEETTFPITSTPPQQQLQGTTSSSAHQQRINSNGQNTASEGSSVNESGPPPRMSRALKNLMSHNKSGPKW